MKKLLLMLAIVSMITLVGCKNNGESIKNNNIQISNESLEKRMTEVTKLKNEKYKNNEFLGYIYAEDLIKNVKLEKADDEYYLKLDIANPTSFSKEEIQNKVKQMKNENLKSVQLGEYTIYRDEKTLLDNLKYEEYKEIISDEIFFNGEALINYDNVPVIIVKDGLPYKLTYSRKSAENYIVMELMAAGASGFTVMENIQIDGIKIKLFADDVICITQLDGAGDNPDIKVTVEEYYNNALANKIEENGYAYNIDGMSTSSGWHGDYMDALEIRNGEIQLFYRETGV